ncbi:phosphoenolpyruvate--protein phosphotransferase [Candidatus Methylopumilus universalis]|jgi:phosphotransferase system enzyme I (PtsI)|uniref:Phosphoenolpyruvate-protein phosphotransferase n=1 Tax=Candidatus Methylopumilus universalis TaxID=2588536 RepID=A0AAX1EYK5_9PROT|nr:phosphoenolpyruvate--protein phosphotransferase [Candidatus Methylopumilus universalis]QDC40589.1 phosphoenolpyruvate--protein phosphotransferase [Candidatus Methylopumilus universalis]QDC41878.1 phosphoenolpyruvate--protein phosphotransferase [Candidatus Methylopumilus universalis]QDC54265.1 phosphoenolpyruvate--protein phosphotransferase [Candidatus Methylopumilus universalis]QDC55547.1 phosphoenolpyruvate--protein phosphotransferase [Candidatus Methylopumilus universalis]QDC56828.1 phosp
MAPFSIHGIGVSNGIAIGRAHLISNALLEVVQYDIEIENIPLEVKRFEDAIAAVRVELNKIKSQLPSDSPKELSAFIDTHLMILNDKSLSSLPKSIIENEKCNAEWAIKKQMDSVVNQFDQIEDQYLRERKQDVIQVVERVIKILLGHSNQIAAKNKEKLTILVAHDISPADALHFKNHKYAAFVTDGGGVTSHTAILSRSLNIPSIVALQNARTLIRDNDLIIVDGSQGVVIVNPTLEIQKHYKSLQDSWSDEQEKLQRIKTKKSITKDGALIHLFANIEVPNDIISVNASGATGVGLFRTEFLFMNRQDMPDEEEQFQAYKKVAEAMGKRPVTIRTLDSGADKQTALNNKKISPNPALGLRAIRLCLSEPKIFMTQLRAILRASQFGNIKILFPMLSSISELRQTKLLLERAKASLRKDKVKFNEKILIGGMIEIPAAAISADIFAQELDFLSIGTNDLIQYALAIDRTDDAVSHLYNPLHPAVLKLIALTIKSANKYKKSIAVCGEMAGEPKLTKLLIGMGVEQLSMHPSHILSVKEQVLNSSIKNIKTSVLRLLNLNEVDKIETLLKKINQS